MRVVRISRSLALRSLPVGRGVVSRAVAPAERGANRDAHERSGDRRASCRRRSRTGLVGRRIAGTRRLQPRDRGIPARQSADAHGGDTRASRSARRTGGHGDGRRGTGRRSRRRRGHAWPRSTRGPDGLLRAAGRVQPARGRRHEPHGPAARACSARCRAWRLLEHGHRDRHAPGAARAGAACAVGRVQRRVARDRRRSPGRRLSRASDRLADRVSCWRPRSAC